ncbi:glyoxalase, partial [Acinetobacter baumannii]|nr:glyoxalase [Acinetobacter baumannii]
IYGVTDAAALQQIAAELEKDRPVTRLADGSIEAADDMGFVLGFQVSVRRPLDLPAEAINAPGAPPQRAPNVVAVDEDAVALPRSLSHV